MRKLLLILMIAMIFPNFARAEELTFDDAKIRLLCAMSSFGSYGGEESILVRSMLTSRGWEAEKISPKNDTTVAKAWLISERGNKNPKMKILSISGTEDLKDVEVDFRVGRVPLDDSQPIEEETKDEKVLRKRMFVHRGFRNYADLVLSEGLKERLIEDLKNNPQETLYITGHSLGGAVALLIGIRLADEGITPDRMKIVTFGAPAIGSKLLTEKYSGKVDLTRITMQGDVVKKSLNVLGYSQFGDSVDYKPARTAKHFEHKMTLYLDCTLRDYYRAGGFENLPEVKNVNKISTPVYVAPLEIVDKSFEEEDEKFIKVSMRDALVTRLANLRFNEPATNKILNYEYFGENVSAYTGAARRYGCKYILVQMLSAKTIRESREDIKRVTLEEMICDLKGMPVSMQTASATTENFTIVEAVILAQENLRETRERVLSGKK